MVYIYLFLILLNSIRYYTIYYCSLNISKKKKTMIINKLIKLIKRTNAAYRNNKGEK